MGEHFDLDDLLPFYVAMTPNIDELFLEVSDKINAQKRVAGSEPRCTFALLTLLKLGMQHPAISKRLLKIGREAFNELKELLNAQPKSTEQAIQEFWNAIDSLETVPEPTEKSHCISTLSYERQLEWLTRDRRLTMALDELAQLDRDRAYWVTKIGDAVNLEMEELSAEDFEQEIADDDENFIFFNQPESA